MLFVHRDAEKQPLSKRNEEIRRAVAMARKNAMIPRYVPVIPVRMTEAWLLFDEMMIRLAAGNPSGTAKVTLPAHDRWDQAPDPKHVLHQALRDATEFQGRRLNRFQPTTEAKRLADLISDYSPLRQLTAFQELEQMVSRELPNLGIELGPASAR